MDIGMVYRDISNESSVAILPEVYKDDEKTSQPDLRIYIFTGITEQTIISPKSFTPHQHSSISRCSSLASSSLSSLSWALLPALALYALASTMVSAMCAT